MSNDALKHNLLTMATVFRKVKAESAQKSADTLIEAVRVIGHMEDRIATLARANERMGKRLEELLG